MIDSNLNTFSGNVSMAVLSILLPMAVFATVFMTEWGHNM
jgi:hypothetical protein